MIKKRLIIIIYITHKHSFYIYIYIFKIKKYIFKGHNLEQTQNIWIKSALPN